MKGVRCIVPVVTALSLSIHGLAFARARVMTDEELDRVSAGGFDISVDQVMAFRAVVEQTHVSSAALDNGRSAAMAVARGAATAAQSNVAAVCSATGDILRSGISNSNQLDAPPLARGSQNNLAVIAAQEGAVRDSAISNTNGVSTPAEVMQDNIGVIVAAGDVVNCAIDNVSINPAVAATGAAMSVETMCVDGIKGVKSIMLTASQTGGQRNVGIIISRFGNVINSFIKNSIREK